MWPSTLVSRYLEALKALPRADWAWAGLLTFCILAAIAIRPKSVGWRRFAAVPAFIGCLALWAGPAWQHRWACDDAFISFRYAQNWVNGHGLVYNPGERVEGYTNFLWTVLIALGLKLRVDPVVFSLALSALSAIATLALVQKLSGDLDPLRRRGLLSPAAVWLAGSLLFAQYTSSGLETMFATLLVTLALERALNRAPLAAGVSGILATMAHPDHALLYASLGIALALRRPREGWRPHLLELARYGVPFFALYVPYFLWRWHYYGDFFPNTYYAKSGGEWYFSQGVPYVLISAATAGVAGSIPLVLIGLGQAHRQLTARYLLFALLLYVPYVMKIGGDFMLGRLLVVLLPAWLLVADGALRRLWSRRWYVPALACALPSISLLLHLQVVRPGEKYHNVADESTFYRLKQLNVRGVQSNLTEMARQFESAMQDTRPRPAVVTGCLGIFGYLTDLKIIDIFGLTDRHVGHQPIKQRARPGHEKWISPAYALASGGDLTEISGIYPGEYEPLTQFRIGFNSYHLIASRPDVMEAMSRWKGTTKPAFESHLSAYRPGADPDIQACDLWFFDVFYFQHRAPQVRAPFVQRLQAAGALSPLAAEIYSAAGDPSSAGWSLVRRFDFESTDPSMRALGPAFAVWPSRTTPLGQVEVGGQRGAFLDSFTTELGDAAHGELVTPEFTLEGEVITLWVGGGRHPQVGVNLEVDGSVVRTARGCNSEIMGRRAWPVAEYRGRRARIRVWDAARSGWSHVVVDTIEEWKR